jgi:LytTr DNA-binding domain
MKKTLKKAAIAVLPSVIPMTVMVYANFIQYRKGWSNLLIQYHTLFWLPRIVLTPLLVITTLKLWRKAGSPAFFLACQLIFFVIFNLISWGLSFIMCRLLATGFDGRNKNLFNTIRYESTFSNLLIYMIVVTMVLVWLYFEKRNESETKTLGLEQSLAAARLELRGLKNRVSNSNAGIEKITTLAVKNGAKTVIIPFTEISIIQSSGSYVKIITESGNHLMKKKLSELQEILPEYFRRVHRSIIVNVSFIKELRSLLNGDSTLLLKNGKEIRASRTFRKNLDGFSGRL